jgi:hypothetical protein
MGPLSHAFYSSLQAMLLLVKEPSLERELGDAGRSRVEKM